MKRIYITLVILLAGMIGMAYLYFSNLHTETSANDSSLNAVAAKSALVFSFDNEKSFYEILSGQDIFAAILGETKAKQLSALNNLVNDANVSNAFSGQKVYIGFLPGEKNSVEFVITSQLKPAVDANQILNGLKSKLKVDKIGEQYLLTFADSAKCYISVQKSLVVLGSTADAVKNINTETDAFSTYIKENSRFSKNTLASLFVNFNTLPQVLKNILNTNLTGELSILDKQNAYATLTYSFSKDKLLFSGNTEINSANSYYKLFVSEAEQKFTIQNILPEKTANFTAFGIADYKKWKNNLNTLFAHTKELEKIDENIKNINQKHRLNLDQVFSSYFKNQLITFQLNTGEKFGAIALSNGEKVEQSLLDVSEEYDTEIRIFREPGIPYAFFGQPFKKFEKPFFVIIDNYLIMANNASSLQVFLSNYRNNKLLTQDESFISFNNQISSSSTILFYINRKNSNDIFGRSLRMPYFKQYQSNKGFKDYNAFSYQLS
ncbi:MAG: hypothetical protein EOO47_08165, partial [Flavobacterium sp.]